jgi:Kelch motif
MCAIRLPTALALLSIAGCGGGGSGPAGVRTAPTIGALAFEPRLAYASPTPTGLSFGFTIFDPERDGSELQLLVRDPAGATVLDQRSPLPGMAVPNATFQFTANASLAQFGRFEVAVQVRDRAGLSSNVLSTAIEVLPYPWLSALPDPVVRTFAAAVAFDGAIAVIGGERRDLGFAPGPPTATVTRLDPVTNSWSIGPPLAVARRALVAAATDQVLVAVGGIDGNGNLAATCEALPSGATAWTLRTPMPTARAHAAAAALGGRVYVLGGTDPTGAALATVESYDPLTDTWRAEPPLPQPRAFGRAAAFAGHLVVAGGQRSASAAAPWLDRFDPVAGAWTSPQQLGDCAYLLTAGSRLHCGFERELFATTVATVDDWRPLTPSLQPVLRGAAAAATADVIYVFAENTAQRYVRALEIR